MGERAQSQRHRELFAILVDKPSWIAGARVRDNETDVQVASCVGQSGDEFLVREIGNDDAMLHPEIPREFGPECVEQGSPAGNQHNVDVRGRDLACEFATDTGRGAGDERPRTKPVAVHSRYHFNRPPWAFSRRWWSSGLSRGRQSADRTCLLPDMPFTGHAFYLVTATKIAVLAWACQEIYISIAKDNVTAPAKQRGRPRGFDRDQALATAIRLFWSRGYEATSVSDLTEAMDITPPSLYAAFGDKKRLFLEAVERYEKETGCFARRALTSEPTAELAIRRLLLDAAKSFTDPKNPKGCLIALGATNCAVESTDVFEALAERRRIAEKAVRARIAAGQKAGELSDNADIDALTGMVTATRYGLAIQARDGVPRARLRRIVEQLMLMWPRREPDEADAAPRKSVAG